MGYTLQAEYRLNPRFSQKSASGDFFDYPNRSTRVDCLPVQQPCREKSPATTRSTSGDTFFRHYDPSTAKWWSADPLESVTGEWPELLPEGSNLYGYVGNDPISFVDEFGLSSSNTGCPLAHPDKFDQNLKDGKYGKKEMRRQYKQYRRSFQKASKNSKQWKHRNRMNHRMRSIQSRLASRSGAARAAIGRAGAVGLSAAAGAYVGDQINKHVLDQPAVKSDCNSPTWNELIGEALYETYPKFFDWVAQ